LYLNEEQDFKIDLQLKNLHWYNNNNNNKIKNNNSLLYMYKQWWHYNATFCFTMIHVNIVCLYNLLWSGGTGQDSGALSIQCTWQE
jgi:hypothetical protein